MIRKRTANKAALARSLGISRASLYYISTKSTRDWHFKQELESILREHPSYGSRRLAVALGVNRKRAQRVMRFFGIRPYRRRGKKPRTSRPFRSYPNLLLTTTPASPNEIWVADFTELLWQQRKVFVATVLDPFTREIVGASVALRRGASLALQALFAALAKHRKPMIFHSDNGVEYDTSVFRRALTDLGIVISRNRPRSPWENGYQESFYDKFKVDLGDPNRLASLGELVYAIYRVIWEYNTTRIHSALKMPPRVFAERYEATRKTLRVAV